MLISCTKNLKISPKEIKTTSMKTWENNRISFIQHRYVRMSVTGLRLVRRGKHLSQTSVWFFVDKMHSSPLNFEENSSRFCQYGPVHLILFVF